MCLYVITIITIMSNMIIIIIIITTSIITSIIIIIIIIIIMRGLLRGVAVAALRAGAELQRGELGLNRDASGCALYKDLGFRVLCGSRRQSPDNNPLFINNLWVVISRAIALSGR